VILTLEHDELANYQLLVLQNTMTGLKVEFFSKYLPVIDRNQTQTFASLASYAADFDESIH
jgi:hypothetical protein